jgi:ribonuclease HII
MSDSRILLAGSQGRSQKLSAAERNRLMRLHVYERALWLNGVSLVAGIDEAGRGPLAGPVVAAAVVLREQLLLPGLNDSKVVPPLLRQALAAEIKQRAVAWAVGIIPAGMIDRYNIHQATFMAMRTALARLRQAPDHVLVDGRWILPGVSIEQTPIIDGDALSAAVAAASIIAKTTRDAIMNYYSRIHPRYHFEQNKGYPTPEHFEALRNFGPCPLHRRTFHGV